MQNRILGSDQSTQNWQKHNAYRPKRRKQSTGTESRTIRHDSTAVAFTGSYGSVGIIFCGFFNFCSLVFHLIWFHSRDTGKQKIWQRGTGT